MPEEDRDRLPAERLTERGFSAEKDSLDDTRVSGFSAEKGPALRPDSPAPRLVGDSRAGALAALRAAGTWPAFAPPAPFLLPHR